MADAVSPGRESPEDVEMGAGYTAGAAFEAAFIGDNDAIFLDTVDIGRTEIEAGLIFAFARTDPRVDNADMGLFIDAKPVEKEFVFDAPAHFTLRKPAHMIRINRVKEILPRIVLHRAFCFPFFEIPFTVRISLAAWPVRPGKRVNIS